MARKTHEQYMKELERETNEMLRKLEVLVERLQDRQELETFKARSAAAYFRQAAADRPQLAGEFNRLAKVAEKVDLAKMRPNPAEYKPNEELNREWHLAREVFKEGINAAAADHIHEFMARSPELWGRLRRHSPELVAQLKPRKNISIKFKL